MLSIMDLLKRYQVRSLVCNNSMENGTEALLKVIEELANA